MEREDITIDCSSESQAEDGILTLVKQLIPTWNELESSHIKIKKMTGGVTNHLYLCVAEPTFTGDVKKVMVRIYGNRTELLVDRDHELSLMVKLYEAGIGPKVFGAFKNGFLYEYFEGDTLDKSEFMSGKWKERIGYYLGKWHSMSSMPGKRDPFFTRKLKKWIQLVPDSYDEPDKNMILKELDVQKIREESSTLINELIKVKSPVVFCHNDVFYENIIINEKELNLIDYEYSNYNFRGFDIANHFVEWGELKYDNYPPREDQYDFFRSYLKGYHNNPDYEATDGELHEIYVEVYKFSLASHFFWATWALIQAKFSRIDYNYLSYAKNRYNEYFNAKDRIIEMQ